MARYGQLGGGGLAGRGPFDDDELPELGGGLQGMAGTQPGWEAPADWGMTVLPAGTRQTQPAPAMVGTQPTPQGQQVAPFAGGGPVAGPALDPMAALSMRSHRPTLPGRASSIAQEAVMRPMPTSYQQRLRRMIPGFGRF